VKKVKVQLQLVFLSRRHWPQTNFQNLEQSTVTLWWGSSWWNFLFIFFLWFIPFWNKYHMLMSGQPGQGQYDMFNVAELKWCVYSLLVPLGRQVGNLISCEAD
jgi:hypothetical protein